MPKKKSASGTAAPSTAASVSARANAIAQAKVAFTQIHRDLQARVNALMSPPDSEAAIRLAVKEWRDVPDESERLFQTVNRFAFDANPVEVKHAGGITLILPLDHPDHPLKHLPMGMAINHMHARQLLDELDVAAKSILWRYCRAHKMETAAFEPAAEIDNREPYAARVVMDLDINAKGNGQPKIGNPSKPPMTPDQQLVFEVLKQLPAGEGMTGAEIIGALKKEKDIEQGTLTSRIIPFLKRHYGVKNQTGAGYYVEQTG